ncbi:MAG: nucleotidyltransferase domain-containing protein [Myxococcota bacterium]
MTHPLLTVLRVPPDELPQAPGSFDGGELVRAAERHGLSGLVMRALENVPLTPALSQREREVLRKHALAIAATGMKLRRLLFQALDALGEEGITPVLLKGYGFASRYWPEPLLRPCSDVDLLVDEHELPAATRVAMKLGLTRHDDPGEDDPFAHHHHLGFHGPAGLLELHFRPIAGFGSAMERARTVEGTLEGRKVRYLTPEDELVYLGAHAAQHCFLRLGWLVDLKFLLGRPLNEQRVVELAQEVGMSGAVFAALTALQTALHFPVPWRLMDGLSPSRWRNILVAAAFTEERLVSASLAQKKLPAFAVRTLLADSLPNMARHSAEGALRALRRAMSARHGKHRARFLRGEKKTWHHPKSPRL